jgi:anti-sigma factor RsiW
MSLCESIDTLAMAYLDDELAPEERRELETHLTECTGCRGEVDSARADQSLIQTSLAAPRASDSMRMRLARSLDEADRETARAERRRMSSWLLPGSAILAAAAAIAVFVGAGTPSSPTSVSPRGKSIAQVAVKQQARALPLEVEGPGTRPWLRQNFASMDLPQVEGPGSKLIGARLLPVDGHDGALLEYAITFDSRPARLKVLVVEDLRDDEMKDGDEVQAGDRTVRVSSAQGHTFVTYVDGQHNGYMFIADELPTKALIDLVGRTSLVGPQ